MPTELEPLEKPDCLDYLWSWFCDLSNGRQYSESGPAALTYNEIQAWASLTKSDPDVWEVGMLRQLDRAFLEEAGKQ